MAKLPGQVYEGGSAHADDILKGLEFGFWAAGVVMVETAKIVMWDVCASVVSSFVQGSAKFAIASRYASKAVPKVLKYFANPSPNAELFAGRLLAADQILTNFQGLIETAESVNSQITKIKHEIYGDKNISNN